MEFLIYVLVILIVYKLNFRALSLCVLSSVKIIRSLFIKYNLVYQGKGLYGQVLELNVQSDLNSFYSYKFFNPLLENVLIISKEFGARFNKPIHLIKRCLLKDVEFEGRLQGFFWQTNMQFLLMTGISWGFTLYSNAMLGQSFKVDKFLILFLWQLIGIISFAVVYKKVKLRLDANFTPVYLNFITYHSLLEVSLPSQRIRSLCRFEALVGIKLKQLDFIIKRFFHLVELRETYGKETLEDMELLLEDLNSLYNIRLDHSIKKMMTLKFIWLCVFFLSSYLLTVYFSISSALI